MSTEKFLFEIAADTKKLREELTKSQAETKKLGSDFGDLENSTGRLDLSLSSLSKGIGFTTSAIIAGTTALVAYATAQGRNIREAEAMATAAGMTAEEFKKMSFVMGTVGISGEKFGDIMKDTQEKIGDFLNTGGGGFQDFADAMGYTKDQAAEVAKEFSNLSGDQVLQQMVDRMQAAGVTSQQMSHALEGMASDTTRLIPLLKNGGIEAERLGDAFDSINIPLSEDEKKQFTELAENVDLAQAAFVNFINNAVAPFLPAINKATKAMTELFASWTAGLEIDQILADKTLVEDIKSLEVIEKISRQIKREQLKLNEDINRARLNGQDSYAKKLGDEKFQLTQISGLLLDQKKIIESTPVGDDLNKTKGNLTASTTNGGAASGADGIDLKQKLLDDLQARQDAQKSALKLLYDERAERLKILNGMYDDENKLSADKLKEKNELKKQIEADYLESAREIAKTEEEAKLEAIVNEQKSLEEILNHKLISQEEYQAKLKEIIGTYAPETLDPDLLEEKNQAELELLNDKLANQLISYEDYFGKLGALQKKDTQDKKDKEKLTGFWSDSALKKQMDNGTALLTSLGNNSKTAHKIKQGLAASNATMSTAEGVMDALSTGNYPSAAYIGLTGAAQVAAILSSKPDGGGSVVSPTAQAPTQQPTESYSEQSSTVTDISGGGELSQRMVIEFSDESIDVIARKIDEAKSNGRV